MEITHENIMKFVRGGQPSWKFNNNVIVYSEDEVKANIYTAMVFVRDRLQQGAAPDSEGRSICDDGEAGCISCGIDCGD